MIKLGRTTYDKTSGLLVTTQESIASKIRVFPAPAVLLNQTHGCVKVSTARSCSSENSIPNFACAFVRSGWRDIPGGPKISLVIGCNSFFPKAMVSFPPVSIYKHKPRKLRNAAWAAGPDTERKTVSTLSFRSSTFSVVLIWVIAHWRKASWQNWYGCKSPKSINTTSSPSSEISVSSTESRSGSCKRGLKVNVVPMPPTEIK